MLDSITVLRNVSKCVKCAVCNGRSNDYWQPRRALRQCNHAINHNEANGVGNPRRIAQIREHDKNVSLYTKYTCCVGCVCALMYRRLHSTAHTMPCATSGHGSGTTVLQATFGEFSRAPNAISVALGRSHLRTPSHHPTYGRASHAKLRFSAAAQSSIQSDDCTTFAFDIAHGLDSQYR
jgi:hypothetical protein